MIYYIIRTTYQKIRDLLWPVHISGLSHSVQSLEAWKPFSVLFVNTTYLDVVKYIL